MSQNPRGDMRIFLKPIDTGAMCTINAKLKWTHKRLYIGSKITGVDLLVAWSPINAVRVPLGSEKWSFIRLPLWGLFFSNTNYFQACPVAFSESATS